MHYVILRDDDTNALTPPACLDRLYRPFLDRGLPVNLAAIPDVRTDVMLPDGQLEGFLVNRNGEKAPTMPIGSSTKLVRYLHDNPGYHVVQHGCHHSANEFDCGDSEAILQRLDRGAQCLWESGLGRPQTFVAPYDKFSRSALAVVAARFRVISTGWFELGRLPHAWWPRYVIKKATQRDHWRVRKTLMLSHPGCLLSYHHDYATMLDKIRGTVASRRLTVLVTHWWEYFRGGQPDDEFIAVLHEAADYLARQPDIKVVTFDDVARGDAPWK